MNDGMTKQTAIELINDGSIQHRMNEIIDYKFGGDNSDYFVLGQTAMSEKATGNEYVVHLVEDYKGEKSRIYFKKV